MAVPDADEVFWSIDAEQLAQAAQGLVGQRRWKVRLAYGDELHLHLGDRVSYSSPRMAGRQRGAWRLGTRASDWTVRRAEQTIASTDAPEAVEIALPGMIEGGAVSALEPSADDSGVRIAFDNESVLMIVPAADEDWSLAAWELSTPAGLFIERGPGRVWGQWRSNRLLDFVAAVREAQRCWTELLASNGQLSDWQSPWNPPPAESPNPEAADGEVFFSAVSLGLGKAAVLVRSADASTRPTTSTRRLRLTDLIRGECFTAICGPKGLGVEVAAQLSNFLQSQPILTGRVP